MSWTDTNYRDYMDQKGLARRRNIDWQLTYEQWLSFWGNDIEKRGVGIGKLQMCRYKDLGPYKLGNIFKDTHERNCVKWYHNGIEIDNVYYNTIGEASRELNIIPQTINWRCKSKNKKFEGYKIL